MEEMEFVEAWRERVKKSERCMGETCYVDDDRIFNFV